MLAHLAIRDIVLIERLDIDFSSGLSVLTGETGAGKSILLDSLSLAIGGRGDASLVRSGQSKGQVTALFDIPINHPARALLRDNDIDDEGDIVLRRVQNSDGRTRIYINDQPSSVALVRELGRLLVEIHGQHDERALVDATAHRDILDAFGLHVGQVDVVVDAYKIMQSKQSALKKHRLKIEAAAREADYLRSSAQELTKLDPLVEEETQLAQTRAAMMRAEKIATDIHHAQDVLNGQNSPISEIAGLMRKLERKAQEVPGMLDDVLDALDQSLIALDSAQLGIDGAMREIEYDPKHLEETEERLFALRAAGRKYNVSVDDLAKLRDTMVADLADMDAGVERLPQLEEEANQACQNYDREAAHLSQLRKAAATALIKVVEDELPALKLERAAFLCQITSDSLERTREGIDHVEFWVRTNPGTKAGPMLKVASGGELSRFLLALKVALADRASAPTLVFDEIDTGVGGAVAAAIGQRLARLSTSVQVLSVTHAPQVAAQADQHYLIAKNGSDDRVATRISLMDKMERQEELARMLSGAEVTQEARAAAKRLLAGK